MKNRNVLHGSMVFLCLLILSGCSSSGAADAFGGGSGTERFLTGTLRDYVTGEPVAGATVDLDGTSVVTGDDGKYSLSMGTSGNIETRCFSFGKTGYQAQCYLMPIDCSGDIDMGRIMLYGINSPAGYATKTISGKIYQIPEGGGAVVEIDYTKVNNSRVTVVNTNGGTNGRVPNQAELNMAYTGTGYSVPVVTFGLDCTVILEISSWKDVYRTTPLIVIKQHVDLSSPETVVDFTETVGSTITVTGDPDAGAKGNTVRCSLIVPSGSYWFPTKTFSGSNTLSYTVINPFDYPVQWKQWFDNSTEIPGFYKDYFAGTASSIMTSSVTLPKIPVVTGMNTPLNIAGIAYSDGIISIPAVPGANMYQFNFVSETAAELRINSDNPAVSLPLWLRTQFSGQTVDVGAYATNVTDWSMMGFDESGYAVNIIPKDDPKTKAVEF